MRDESGQIVKWYGTNFDIEDRKRAEDEVRQNEQHLRAIINTIPTLSWSTRPDGYVEFLSQRWLDFTGLSAEQAEGFGWTVAIHPDDAPRLGAYWQPKAWVLAFHPIGKQDWLHAVTARAALWS